MRKTKIICTTGPALDDERILTKVAKEMDCARFNFSHGTYEEHLKRIKLLRSVCSKIGRPIAFLADTKGPEIRTGLLKDHKEVYLKKGNEITLTPKKIVGTEKEVSITYSLLYKDVKIGTTILIDDGLIGLQVKKICGKDIICSITDGGKLGERKGINIPRIRTALPDFTIQDEKDIKFAIKNDFDYVALSFVRNANCVKKVRSIIDKEKSSMKIISKIENEEGLINFDEILDASDGIMIARGDLGVEIEMEKLPSIQKKIILECRKKSKIVITATQMLESMVNNIRPTRAEVSDVSNAVYDGTDCVMLSGETASGKHPFEAVTSMAKIVEFTENCIDYSNEKVENLETKEEDYLEKVIATSCVDISNRVNAKCIIVPTTKGRTAKHISKIKSKQPVYAFTHNEKVLRQMMLFFGVYPIISTKKEGPIYLYKDGVDILKKKKIIKKNDVVVFLAGVSFIKNTIEAATNTISVFRID